MYYIVASPALQCQPKFNAWALVVMRDYLDVAQAHFLGVSLKRGETSDCSPLLVGVAFCGWKRAWLISSTPPHKCIFRFRTGGRIVCTSCFSYQMNGEWREEDEQRKLLECCNVCTLFILVVCHSLSQSRGFVSLFSSLINSKQKDEEKKEQTATTITKYIFISISII